MSAVIVLSGVAFEGRHGVTSSERLSTRRFGAGVTPVDDSALSGLALLAGTTGLLVAHDLSTSLVGDVPASARLLHLVTYNYKRSWPASLDFEAATWAFGAALAVATLALSMPRTRRVLRWPRIAARLMVAVLSPADGTHA